MGQETTPPGKHRGVPQTTQRFEMEIYRLQEAQIRLLYGREAAKSANYGWSVDADEDATVFCTKVYLPDPIIIQTRIETDTYNW